MAQLRTSSARRRRVWRITPATPLGEIVEADAPLAFGSGAAPDVDKTADGGWLGSSFDLLNGLEVTETSPGELSEELFRSNALSRRDETVHAASAVSKHQWILRFALKMATLDLHSDPKSVIALARELWPTRGLVEPEEEAKERLQSGH